MLQRKPLEDRRTRSTQLIRKLIHSRQELLASYQKLVERRPFTDCPEAPRLLQRLCQLLVDYTANAHFQLFRHFAEQRERRRAAAAVAREIYPEVMALTQAFLDFNDKYDCGDHCRVGPELAEDLARLGEQLAVRFELEDRIVEAFLGRR